MNAGLLFESSLTAGRGSLLPDDSAFDSKSLNKRGDIRVGIEPMPAFDELARDWRALEARGDGSFFTSWSWIGALVRTLPTMPGLRLVRATKGLDTVGLCLVNRHRQPWRGRLSTSALLLNATGDADLDRITSEHNDILCERALAPAVRHGVVKALLELDRGWDELHLPGVMPEDGWTSRLPGRLVPLVRVEPCFEVDLTPLRPDKARQLDAAHPSTGEPTAERYFNLLSSNTRAQLRRSLKEYGKLGTVQLVEAASVDQALLFMNGLRDLHQAYWTARGEPGAFGDPYFEQFHRQLITTALARGEIQMLRMQAGGVVIGYLYNFVWRGRVMNYQSGFDYAVCEKHGRPGLVAQALAVSLNADRGATVYDFMAGSNRTKESLATRRYDMAWIVMRRPRLKFWFEERLRDAKRLWAGRRGAPVADDLAGVTTPAAE